MAHGWPTTTFSDHAHVLEKLAELQGDRWICRGQSEPWGTLQPSIDREGREHLSRIDKLKLERQSIDLFRSTARAFAGDGEQGAMADEIIALMVMRHYRVPTRLLDWSLSPYVAAFFACDQKSAESKEGEVWAFSNDRYESQGNEQWQRMPEALRHGEWEARFTAFTAVEPPDWFACGFYPLGFPRQRAQHGLYSITARFGRGHEQAIAKLLANKDSHHLYLIPAALKPGMRKHLRESHGIWEGSLFPDSAGAAETVKRHIFPQHDGSR